MPPEVGYIRVKLIHCEKGRSSIDSSREVFDPFVCVNVKETVNTPGTPTLQVLHWLVEDMDASHWPE